MYKNIKQFVKKIVKMSFGLVLIGNLSSCTLDIPPADQYADPDAIINIKTAREFLTNAYMEFPHVQYELSVLGNDFSMTENTRYDVEIKNLYHWKHKNVKEMAESLWLEYYHVIADLDALNERLKYINPSSNTAKQKKNQIIAEMYTLKALAYFNLLRLYAPRYEGNEDGKGLIIKKFLGVEHNKRSSISSSVQYISDLLREASSNIMSKEEAGNSARYSWLYKEGVEYLRAELALYCGDYKSVVNLLKPLYENVPSEIKDYSTLWTRGNPYIIFAFNTRSVYYKSIEYDTNNGDYFALNQDFEFADEDLRQSSYSLINDDFKGVLFGKYNKIKKDGGTVSYIDNIRYSGVFFMLAEAYARLGKDDEARSVINEYLTNVNASLIASDVSGMKLITAILFEKNKEFAGEGRNYFDLKRIGKYMRKKGLWNASGVKISGDDYRWTFPIPSTEIRYNDVTQNPEW